MSIKITTSLRECNKQVNSTNPAKPMRVNRPAQLATSAPSSPSVISFLSVEKIFYEPEISFWIRIKPFSDCNLISGLIDPLYY
ncbi:5799_t:CDS:2 [Ambispora leptoticha]|uniref:5799_t:CDS:1 n=1 Tax=Ambispora leptoticha TaxID=144679 RepID=A0A9N9G2Z2_9GLOM|nr:5799_t:CDS:2 [Ambispora leptoticha]